MPNIDLDTLNGKTVKFKYYTNPEYVFDSTKTDESTYLYAELNKENDSIYKLNNVRVKPSGSGTESYVIYKNLLNPYEFKCDQKTIYINYKNINSMEKVGGSKGVTQNNSSLVSKTKKNSLNLTLSGLNLARPLSSSLVNNKKKKVPKAINVTPQ